MGATRPPTDARSETDFAEADEAASGLASIGALVVVLLAGILIPVIAMDLLADLLPEYFLSLGNLFTGLAAVNTTGWPGIVATMFGFVDIILGVTAVAAVFGLGAFLVIRARRTA